MQPCKITMTYFDILIDEWYCNIEKHIFSVKCKDVQNEPVLLPVDGLELPKGTVLGDQARLDISAKSIWNASEINLTMCFRAAAGVLVSQVTRYCKRKGYYG